jgi:Cys-rich protein (TIGR01571 family)
MNRWQSGIISYWCSNKINCLYGCFCPACAVATAKTNFDDTNWVFNFCCFGLSANQCIVRSYIRNGYEIEGNHMSDCFYSYCCIYCSATQLLNEVENRKKRIHNGNDNGNIELKYKYEKIMQNTPICFDNISSNIDCLCVCLDVKSETASLYSTFTGYPFWYSYLSNVNIFQLNHMIRQEYDISGGEFQKDIIVPSIFTYTTIETIRQLLLTKNNNTILPVSNMQWYTNDSIAKVTNEETIKLFENFELPK